MNMSKENALRLAERQERDRPRITEEDVEDYTRVHFPEHIAEAYVPGRRGRPMPVPGDYYVAALSHERFHEWFGTECDGTCPHGFEAARPSLWRRVRAWFGANK